MDTQKVLIFLVIGLIIGGAVGYGSTYSQINPLKAQVTLLDDQVTDLKIDVDKLPGLKGQVTDLTAEKNNLQDQVTPLEDQVTDLTAVKNSLQDQVTLLQDQLNIKTEEVNTLNAQLTEAETQITLKDSQIATLQSQTTSIDDEIEALELEISELQGQVPPYTQGAWNTIKTFSSSGERNTELFNIPHNQARISWTYVEDDYLPYMYVKLFEQNSASRI